MCADFKAKGMELIKEAVQEDESGNYEKAIDKYSAGLEYFKAHLKYDETKQYRQIIKAKFTEYLERAEYLKNTLKDWVQERGAPSSAVPSRGLTQAIKKEYGKRKEEEKNQMQEIVSRVILSEKPDVKWDDVAGLERAKEALKEDALMPINFPQFFTGQRKPCSAVLLYGPPGSGKSYLARALATDADSQFFRVVASDLVFTWVNEGEKLVSTLFETARRNTPAIVFLDDLDALCNASGDNDSEAARRIKTQFLIEMQVVKNAKNSWVLVLGATNLPYILDQAVLRQFSRKIYVTLPEAPARKEMFRIHLRAAPNLLEDKDFEDLGKMTEGFSGLDISAVVEDASMQPLCLVRQPTHFRQIPGEDSPNYMPCEPTAPGAREMNLQYLANNGIGHKVVPPWISINDFETVLAKAKPNVGRADLEVFERFIEEFGEDG